MHHHLISETRLRYKENVKICRGYSLRTGIDSKSSAHIFPDTSHGDIVNYLVLSISQVSLGQMKAYLVLDADIVKITS